MVNKRGTIKEKSGIRGNPDLFIGALCFIGAATGVGLGYFWGYDLLRNYMAQSVLVAGMLLVLLVACTFLMIRIYAAPNIKPKKAAHEISQGDPDYKEVKAGNETEDLQRANEKIKETQSQLMHAEKMGAIGKIASGIAHEVKNALGIVIQSIDYLEDDAKFADKSAQEAFGIMKGNLERADNIVRTLVDFSKLRKLQKTRSGINEVLEKAMVLIQYAFKKANVDIVKEMGDGLPDVYIDKGKIEQVLVNIFLNAIQAMPEGGAMYVRTKTEKFEGISCKGGGRKSDGDCFSPGERVVVIEIEDTGKGISLSDMEKVFEPFFTTKGAEGTGIGLAVTKNIMELHRGIIEIHSKVAKGTTVTIKLKIFKETSGG